MIKIECLFFLYDSVLEVPVQHSDQKKKLKETLFNEKMEHVHDTVTDV